MSSQVPKYGLEQFGVDHWSVLLLVEDTAVNHGGYVHHLSDHMRRMSRRLRTTLHDGTQAPVDHDDWSCLADLGAEGLVNEIDGGKPLFDQRVSLTTYGWYVAGLLRRARAEGKNDKDFVAPFYGFTPESLLKRSVSVLTMIRSTGGSVFGGDLLDALVTWKESQDPK